MIILQPDRILIKRDLAALAPRLHGDILDVGGGDGKRYKHLFPQAKSLRSLDIDASQQPDIVGSAEAMPVPDNSVDGILCAQMLEHVPHPWKALSEMHRILRSGGKVILTAPQWNEMHEEPHDYYRYTNFGLKVLCEEAGFRVLEARQRGRYWSLLAQTVIRYWIDLWKPYKRAWIALMIAPLAWILVRTALLFDRLDRSDASRRHVIGWAFLLEKP